MIFLVPDHSQFVSRRPCCSCLNPERASKARVCPRWEVKMRVFTFGLESDLASACCYRMSFIGLHTHKKSHWLRFSCTWSPSKIRQTVKLVKFPSPVLVYPHPRWINRCNMKSIIHFPAACFCACNSEKKLQNIVPHLPPSLSLTTVSDLLCKKQSPCTYNLRMHLNCIFV